MTQTLEVIIVGGGPAGLSAALALGRARRHVAVLDGGARRNTRAEHMHNFLSRDGITPNEFRRICREQLRQYTTVTHQEVAVRSIQRRVNDFEVQTNAATLWAKRILICTGLVDEPLAIEGADELWGTSIFQCPYCHGWENRDLRWGYLMHGLETVDFALQLPCWTASVTLFTNGGVRLPPDVNDRLTQRGIRIEARTIARLQRKLVDGKAVLNGLELADGAKAECDVLFAHPKQHQVQLVSDMGIALDEHGFVAADPMTRRTSLPGVYAAGDSTTRMQGAILAAAAGTHAAAMLNHDLATA